MGQIHKYSVNLYSSLEAETGQNVGFKTVSNIRLARTKDRWDEFMYYAGVAETIGVKVNVLTPAQVKEIWPLCETDGLIGAIQHPDDGYIQPADLTQAIHVFLARSAAGLVAVQAEDLVGMADPVNVPGTSDEHANWQRKMSGTLDAMFDGAQAGRLLDAVRPARTG